MAVEHFDVVVVGAGISGIDAAYHLTTECPDRSFVVLEGRDDIGGTWDLFRYPSVCMSLSERTPGYRNRSHVPPMSSRPSSTTKLRSGHSVVRW